MRTKTVADDTITAVFEVKPQAKSKHSFMTDETILTLDVRKTTTYSCLANRQVVVVGATSTVIIRITFIARRDVMAITAKRATRKQRTK